MVAGVNGEAGGNVLLLAEAEPKTGIVHVTTQNQLVEEMIVLMMMTMKNHKPATNRIAQVR